MLRHRMVQIFVQNKCGRGLDFFTAFLNEKHRKKYFKSRFVFAAKMTFHIYYFK